VLSTWQCGGGVRHFFAKWSAGLGRLLDRGEVVIIRGASYRTQGRARLTEEVASPQKQP